MFEFTPVVAATSSLLMAVVEEASDLLLHGSKRALCDPALWYLDTGATNHMTGDIEINQKDGGILQLLNVLFVSDLVAKIGGLRLPLPPKQITTVLEEPTPTRVQPPRRAKTKDDDFRYTA